MPGSTKTCWNAYRRCREVRAAAPVIEAAVDTGIRGQGNLLILGVDMTGDRSLRDYDLESGDEAVIDDPLVFLAQPDSLIVTEKFADARTARHRQQDCRCAPCRATQAVHRARHHEAGRPGQRLRRQPGIMDIYAAQKVFGRGRKFDRIDLGAEGRRHRSTQAHGAIRGRSARDSRWSRPSAAASSSNPSRACTRWPSNITSVFALFIGMFIIYNSFAIAVTQRRRRSASCARWAPRAARSARCFWGRARWRDWSGSLRGLPFGIAIARAMTGYIGG